MNGMEALQLSMPSPTYLIGAVVFGIIGYAAYRYGKKNAHPHAKWLGVALMFFPYAVSRTSLLYVIGVTLCAALYVFRG